MSTAPNQTLDMEQGHTFDDIPGATRTLSQKEYDSLEKSTMMQWRTHMMALTKTMALTQMIPADA